VKIGFIKNLPFDFSRVNHFQNPFCLKILFQHKKQIKIKHNLLKIFSRDLFQIKYIFEIIKSLNIPQNLATLKVHKT